MKLSGWKLGICAAILATSGCVSSPGGPIASSFTERGVFAQSSDGAHGTAIGGNPPDGAFLVDLTIGHDSDTQNISNWTMDAGWLQAEFSPHNVQFDRHGMTLKVTRRNGGPTPYVSAEFERVGFYGYGRYEVVMKSANMPGVVSSFFTHTGEYHGDPHSEIDFEFVGGKPRELHTNYFWDGASDALDIPLGFDASEDFHVYAFEWLPDQITWYVDGQKVRTVESASASVPIPAASGRVMANIWAANNQALEWVGAPVGEGTSAVYRCMSHVPIGETGRQCSDEFEGGAR